jgi:monoamine oxidase
MLASGRTTRSGAAPRGRPDAIAGRAASTDVATRHSARTMPRTPLANFVARLVHDMNRTSAAADGAAPSPSRRRFLAGSAAAAVAANLPAPLARVRARKGAQRVAVVGAGLAGLTCAYRLQQRGIAAEVYEASTRFGGRCWTRRGAFADGQIGEHGGELIDQSHVAIRSLAQEFNLPLVNVLAAEANGTETKMRFLGSDYSINDAENDLKAIWKQLRRDVQQASYPTTYYQSTARGRQLDNTSIAQWIQQTVPGGLGSRFGQLLATAYNIEYGAEVDQQSSLNLLYLLGYSGPGRIRIFGPSNEKYKVVGGNDQIAAALAAQVAPQLVPQHTLLSVAKLPSGRIRLVFATPGPNVTEDFDHVVFALPFAVMRSSVNLAQAGWSPRKMTAIQQLGRGSNSKLAVQFATRHWRTQGGNGESYSDLGYQCSWEVTRGQTGTPGILVNYSGGLYAESFAGASATARAQQFCQQVEPVFSGSTANWNGLATLDTWHDKPLQRCSYSYWRVGQCQLFAGVEGEPEDNAWFCGEHTSLDAQGYLEGAVETGERAADEVATAIG